MHMVIYAIVYAENEYQAMRQARKVFRSLCGEKRPFDYYTTFDEDGSQTSGKGRWGDLTPVARASSEEGKRYIEQAMKSTRDEFQRNLDEVKQSIASYSDEQLFEREDMVDGVGGLFRWRCSRLGADEGPVVWLYDHEAEGVKDSRILKAILEKWSEFHQGEKNPYEDLEVWVVPADVHY